ncbi:MAG TPA: glycosyltransferase family 2 protein [Rhizomicrobium sp.]|jgi:cellulose synthase/poly-beta-1,6-N-acetylglucosamine synthase-like glycosyltransferase|nr:glycosyltransferase family 2 protein [Rhizomicrobium sp.]
MHGLSLFLQFALCIVLISVCTLSVQLALLAWVRVFRRRPDLKLAPMEDAALPHVLVQLPVCNEGPLAVRVARAAAAMDWPQGRLTIQILDDGDDQDHAALAQAVRAAVPQGVNLQVLRRGNRKGFKAGNLAFGLSHSDAPFVAVFDADFVPPADFLRRTIPALLADSGLAFVQARWGHANRAANWLTRVQGVLLDSHFAVEQEARFRAGLPMSFNGSAGVWNRIAIEQGGGWSGDTLTEDLDLSMRCMMQGWRGAIVSDLVVPGELPQTAAAWRAQQARWTKGHAQVARKLLPQIWASAMPAWKKAAMSLQMCQFGFYMLAFASAAISLTLMYMGVVYLAGVALLGLVVTLLGLACSLFYLWLGQRMLERHEEPRLIPSLLLAVVFPSGLILANTRATYDAFFSNHMDFNRTIRVGETYKGAWRGGPELVAGLLLPVFALAEQPIGAPFFFFAVAGLVSIGVMGVAGSPKPVRQQITPGE